MWKPLFNRIILIQILAYLAISLACPFVPLLPLPCLPLIIFMHAFMVSRMRIAVITLFFLAWLIGAVGALISMIGEVPAIIAWGIIFGFATGAVLGELVAFDIGAARAGWPGRWLLTSLLLSLIYAGFTFPFISSDLRHAVFGREHGDGILARLVGSLLSIAAVWPLYLAWLRPAPAAASAGTPHRPAAPGA